MKLKKDNYYSLEIDREYMSVSQFKGFLSCEARQKAYLDGKYTFPESDALIIGSLVDRAIESDFALQEYIDTTDGIKGRNGALYAKYGIYKSMVETLTKDELCSAYLTGRKQVIGTGELFGIKWKYAVDVEGDNFITDLKTTKSIDNIHRALQIPIWEEGGLFIYGYYLQMAVYSHFIPKERYIVAVSKEKIHDKEIFSLNNQERINNELSFLGEILPRSIAVKNGDESPIMCGQCDYCRMNKEIIIPVEV